MNLIIEQKITLHTLDKGTDYDEIVISAYHTEIEKEERAVLSKKIKAGISRNKVKKTKEKVIHKKSKKK